MQSPKSTLTGVQVLHTVRLAAQSAPASKDMNFIPAPSLGIQQGAPSQAASARLARDELVLRVCMYSRHKPDKLLQVTAAMSSLPSGFTTPGMGAAYFVMQGIIRVHVATPGARVRWQR